MNGSPTINATQQTFPDWFVLAAAGELCRENRCFSEAAYSVPGGGLYLEIANVARWKGLQPLTLDVAERHLAAGQTPRSITLLSELGFGLESRASSRASHKILYCLESPLQAKAFHLRLPILSKRFDRALLFSGLLRHSRAAQNSVIHFPIREREQGVAQIPVAERRLLVAVNANKSPYASDDPSVPRIRALVRDAIYLLVGSLSSVIGAEDYYKVRRKVFRECSSSKHFDLYGQGWDRDPIVAGSGVWRGALAYEAKHEVLRNYKFCLCFENCAFPGYITEKIYDCFTAGLVPVYCGAPDISMRIPKGSYIDFWKYRDSAAMLEDLENMSGDEFDRYLEQGRNVLRSSEFACTSPRYLAELIVSR